MSFTTSRAQTLVFWKSTLRSVWSLVGTVVLLWKRRTEVWEQRVQSEDPLGCTGTDNFLFLEHLWERCHCLSGDKRAESCHGASPLLKRREGQRQLLRMANLDSGFLLCFPLNSMLLHVGVTVLGKISPASVVKPSPRGPMWYTPCWVLKVWNFEIQLACLAGGR